MLKNDILKDKTVLEKFILLTEYTIPPKEESKFADKFLPSNCEKDARGNFFIKISESDTVFTSHLDSYCKDYDKVNHIFDGQFVKTDGNTILGSDDKSGVLIMLEMINTNKPGLYYFFVEEELGCKGSFDVKDNSIFKNYNKVISFDRKGYNSIITKQYTGVGCSDLFAYSLSKEYANNSMFFYPDDTGYLTDSAVFNEIINETTNLSVGSFNQHMTTEKQDILFLEKFIEATINVDFEKLLIGRDLIQIQDMKIKQMREQAHLHFDRLWKEFQMTRDEAYIWLKVWMMERGEHKPAHISHLNEKECYLLIKDVKKYIHKLKEDGKETK